MPPTTTQHNQSWRTATIYHIAHAYPLAIKHYKRALRIHPSNSAKSKLWFNIGQAQRSLYDRYLATQYLQQAVLLAPCEPLYWYALGMIAAEMQEWGKAARWFLACLCVVAPDVAGVRYTGEGLGWGLGMAGVVLCWRYSLARWKRCEEGHDGGLEKGYEEFGFESGVSRMPRELFFGPI